MVRVCLILLATVFVACSPAAPTHVSGGETQVEQHAVSSGDNGREGAPTPGMGPAIEKASQETQVEQNAANSAKCVAGTMIVKCTITRDGVLANFQIIKSLSPAQDQIALSKLSNLFVGIHLYQGQPLTIDYTIPLKFKCD